MKRAKELVIPEYVVKMLKKYGNAALGSSINPAKNKTEIIEKLKALGFNCEMRTTEEVVFYPVAGNRKRQGKLSYSLWLL